MALTRPAETSPCKRAPPSPRVVTAPSPRSTVARRPLAPTLQHGQPPCPGPPSAAASAQGDTIAWSPSKLPRHSATAATCTCSTSPPGSAAHRLPSAVRPTCASPRAVSSPIKSVASTARIAGSPCRASAGVGRAMVVAASPNKTATATGGLPPTYKCAGATNRSPCSPNKTPTASHRPGSVRVPVPVPHNAPTAASSPTKNRAPSETTKTRSVPAPRSGMRAGSRSVRDKARTEVMDGKAACELGLDSRSGSTNKTVINPEPKLGVVGVNKPGDGLEMKPGGGGPTKLGIGMIPKVAIGAMTKPTGGLLIKLGIRSITKPGNGAVAKPGSGLITKVASGVVTRPVSGVVTKPRGGAITKPGGGATIKAAGGAGSRVPSALSRKQEKEAANARLAEAVIKSDGAAVTRRTAVSIQSAAGRMTSGIATTPRTVVGPVTRPSAGLLTGGSRLLRKSGKVEVPARVQGTTCAPKYIQANGIAEDDATAATMNGETRAVADGSRHTKVTSDVSGDTRTVRDESGDTKSVCEESRDMNAEHNTSKDVKALCEERGDIKAMREDHGDIKALCEDNEDMNELCEDSRDMAATCGESEGPKPVHDVSRDTKAMRDKPERIDKPSDVTEEPKAAFELSDETRTAYKAGGDEKAAYDVSEEVETHVDVGEQKKAQYTRSGEMNAESDVSVETKAVSEVGGKSKSTYQAGGDGLAMCDDSKGEKDSVDVNGEAQITLNVMREVKTSCDLSQELDMLCSSSHSAETPSDALGESQAARVDAGEEMNDLARGSGELELACDEGDAGVTRGLYLAADASGAEPSTLAFCPEVISDASVSPRAIPKLKRADEALPKVKATEDGLPTLSINAMQPHQDISKTPTMVLAESRASAVGTVHVESDDALKADILCAETSGSRNLMAESSNTRTVSVSTDDIHVERVMAQVHSYEGTPHSSHCRSSVDNLPSVLLRDARQDTVSGAEIKSTAKPTVDKNKALPKDVHGTKFISGGGPGVRLAELSLCEINLSETADTAPPDLVDRALSDDRSFQETLSVGVMSEVHQLGEEPWGCGGTLGDLSTPSSMGLWEKLDSKTSSPTSTPEELKDTGLLPGSVSGSNLGTSPEFGLKLKLLLESRHAQVYDPRDKMERTLAQRLKRDTGSNNNVVEGDDDDDEGEDDDNEGDEDRDKFDNDYYIANDEKCRTRVLCGIENPAFKDYAAEPEVKVVWVAHPPLPAGKGGEDKWPAGAGGGEPHCDDDAPALTQPPDTLAVEEPPGSSDKQTTSVELTAATSVEVKRVHRWMLDEFEDDDDDGDYSDYSDSDVDGDDFEVSTLMAACGVGTTLTTTAEGSAPHAPPHSHFPSGKLLSPILELDADDSGGVASSVLGATWDPHGHNPADPWEATRRYRDGSNSPCDPVLELGSSLLSPPLGHPVTSPGRGPVSVPPPRSLSGLCESTATPSWVGEGTAEGAVGATPRQEEEEQDEEEALTRMSEVLPRGRVRPVQGDALSRWSEVLLSPLRCEADACVTAVAAFSPDSHGGPPTPGGPGGEWTIVELESHH